MESSLRFLHALLRGDESSDGYRRAPDGFMATARECDDKIVLLDTTDSIRGSLAAAVESARSVYVLRNRYMHDVLVHEAGEGWIRTRLAAPKKGEPATVPVVTGDMVTLVEQAVAANWRLRAGLGHLRNPAGTWADLLLGHVNGDWDGSANWHTEDDGTDDED